MKASSALEAEIRKELSKARAGIFFRANAGLAWTGDQTVHVKRHTTVRVQPGDVVIRNGRPFHGMPKGFLDIVGISPTKITEDMVGQTVGVFCMIDSKDGKYARLTPEQRNMVEQIRSLGGRAGEARSPEQAVAIATNITRNG